MKGKLTNSLKPPLTKRPFAVGYQELYELTDWKLRVSETKKIYWLIKVNLRSSEVKQYEKTMTNKQSQKENGGGWGGISN